MCKDVCQRTEFEELEIITGTCKYEGACFFEVGGCPLQRLSDAMYVAAMKCEFYHCDDDTIIPHCLKTNLECDALNCEYYKTLVK